MSFRFARVKSSWNRSADRVEELLKRAELDLLQLDYHWPARWPCSTGDRKTPWKSWATGFSDQWRKLHKSIYLEPDLKLVTHAGGGDLMGCMEALAQFLVDHGNADLPIAAVRGGNLLPLVDEWMPRDLLKSGNGILAAQWQIGGGPLATALAEGARIVVTSDYDSTAPLTAMAVARGLCVWENYAMLGELAVAAQLTNVVVEVGPTECVEVLPIDGTLCVNPRTNPETVYADVSVDRTSATWESLGQSRFHLQGVQGKPPTGNWQVRVVEDAGYQGAILVECDDTDSREIIETCRIGLEAQVVVTRYVATDNSPGTCGNSLKWSFRESQLEKCLEVLELVQSRLEDVGRGRIVEPPPSVDQLAQEYLLSLPRDRWNLAVDTRPAREWL